jgi:hypothetical protein
MVDEERSLETLELLLKEPECLSVAMAPWLTKLEMK